MRFCRERERDSNHKLSSNSSINAQNNRCACIILWQKWKIWLYTHYNTRTWSLIYMDYYVHHRNSKTSCKVSSKGFLFWNPVSPELWNLGALKPWKPATLDSWSLVTFEPWSPATLESCNPGSPEPWNFQLFASPEPALGTLKLYLKLWILGLSQYGSLGPWNLGTRKLCGSRVMEWWNPKLGILQP